VARRRSTSSENVEKADATGIYNALHASMTRVGLEATWKSKMVGFGSDGAAVMTGKNGGVIGKLNVDQPFVQVGCDTTTSVV